MLNAKLLALPLTSPHAILEVKDSSMCPESPVAPLFGNAQGRRYDFLIAAPSVQCHSSSPMIKTFKYMSDASTVSSSLSFYCLGVNC
jgi:hypothetical protein